MALTVPVNMLLLRFQLQDETIVLRHASNNNCSEMSFIDDNTSLLHANGIELMVIPEE